MEQVAIKPRVFVYEGREYADPGVQFSNETVRDMLARTFGALAGGEIDVKEQEKQTVVTFTPRPQRKGGGVTLLGIIDEYEKAIEVDEKARHQSIAEQAERLWSSAFNTADQVLRDELLHPVPGTLKVVEVKNGESVREIRLEVIPDWPRVKEVNFRVDVGVRYVRKQLEDHGPHEELPALYMVIDPMKLQRVFIDNVGDALLPHLAKLKAAYERTIQAFDYKAEADRQNAIEMAFEKIHKGTDPHEARETLLALDVASEKVEAACQKRAEKDKAAAEYKRKEGQFIERYEAYRAEYKRIVDENRRFLAALQDEYDKSINVWELSYVYGLSTVEDSVYSEMNALHVVEDEPNDRGFWSAIINGEIVPTKVFTPVTLTGPEQVSAVDRRIAKVLKVAGTGGHDFCCPYYVPEEIIRNRLSVALNPLPDEPEEPEWMGRTTYNDLTGRSRW